MDFTGKVVFPKFMLEKFEADKLFVEKNDDSARRRL
jgi:hypothetical protein